MKIILASGSEARARMLRSAGVDFEIRAAHVDEERVKAARCGQGMDATAIAVELAKEKALIVSRETPGALVIGADQVLEFGSELISKSPDLDAARELLMRLRGKNHALLTATTLAKDGVVVWSHHDRAELTMRPFTEEFLDRYLAQEGEQILGCVGVYRLEDLGAQLFSAIEGDYFSILGLPLLSLLAALRRYGAISS